MLAREHRYPFFQGVPEQTYSTHFFTLRYRIRKTGGIRAAFVAGKKVHKQAYVRHRVKRVFSEAFSDLVPDFESSYDIVFYIKSASVEVEAKTIQEAIHQSLLKIGVVQ